MNNLLHLKYAVEVEKTGSISKAASNLFMNQPQLSKAIRELEASIGVIIFDRTPTGVFPTEKGLLVLAHAKAVIAQVEAMQAVGKQEQEESRILNISVPRASYVAEAFTEFLKLLDGKKGMDIDYRETYSVRAIKTVSEGSNDMGIIRCQSKFEGYFLTALQKHGLKNEDIFEFEYLVLMSKNHPLADDEIVDYAKITKYTELIHGDLSVPSLPAVAALDDLEPLKNAISIYERASQLEILEKIPYTYMWVSAMPENILEKYNLVQKRCNHSAERYKDMLIYRDGYIFTKYDKLFIEQVHKTAAKLNSLE